MRGGEEVIGYLPHHSGGPQQVRGGIRRSVSSRPRASGDHEGPHVCVRSVDGPRGQSQGDHPVQCRQHPGAPRAPRLPRHHRTGSPQEPRPRQRRLRQILPGPHQKPIQM